MGYTGNHLVLPALEMAYWFLAIAHAPRDVLAQMIVEVDGALKELESSGGPSRSRQGYWDDVCLVRFLEGVCLRFIAYPVRPFQSLVRTFAYDFLKDTDAATSSPTVSDATLSTIDAAHKAEESLKAVFEHGPDIEWDHHLVYYARRSFLATYTLPGD